MIVDSMFFLLGTYLLTISLSSLMREGHCHGQRARYSDGITAEFPQENIRYTKKMATAILRGRSP